MTSVFIKQKEWMLVTVEKYDRDKGYIHGRSEGLPVIVARKHIEGRQTTRKDNWFEYLSDPDDKKSRYAPSGSVIAVFNATRTSKENDNGFYIASWATTISKTSKHEDIYVTPIRVSSKPKTIKNPASREKLHYIDATVLDSHPKLVSSEAHLKSLALELLRPDCSTSFNLHGPRGFMIRLGRVNTVKGSADFNAWEFFGREKSSPEDTWKYHDKQITKTPGAVSNRLNHALAQVREALKEKNCVVYVVGMSRVTIMDYGQEKVVNDLAQLPNYKMTGPSTGQQEAYSLAAIAVEKSGRRLIKKQVAMPNKPAKTDLTGVFGNHLEAIDSFIRSTSSASTLIEQARVVKENQLKLEQHVGKNGKVTSFRIVGPRWLIAEHKELILSAIPTMKPYTTPEGGYAWPLYRLAEVRSSLSKILGMPPIYLELIEVEGERKVAVKGLLRDRNFADVIENAIEGYPAGYDHLLNCYIFDEIHILTLQSKLRVILGSEPSFLKSIPKIIDRPEVVALPQPIATMPVHKNTVDEARILNSVTPTIEKNEQITSSIQSAPVGLISQKPVGNTSSPELSEAAADYVPEEDHTSSNKTGEPATQSMTNKLGNQNIESKSKKVGIVNVPSNVTKQYTKKLSFYDWVAEEYGNDPVRILEAFTSSIHDVALEAGIDWKGSRLSLKNISNGFKGKVENAIRKGQGLVSVKPEHAGSVMADIWYNRIRGQDHENGSTQERIEVYVTFLNQEILRDNAIATYSSFNDLKQAYNSANGISRIRSPQEEQAHIKVLEEDRKRREKAAAAAAQAVMLERRASREKWKRDIDVLAREDGNEDSYFKQKGIEYILDLLDVRKGHDPVLGYFNIIKLHDIDFNYLGAQRFFAKPFTDEKGKLNNKLHIKGTLFKTEQGDNPTAAHFIIGDISKAEDRPLIFCEGLANGAVTNHVTRRDGIGVPVVVCINANNIDPVVQAYRERYPKKRFIIVSDNDAYKIKKGNVGVLSALDAARKSNAEYVIPDFSGLPIESKPNDIHDLFSLSDTRTVLSQLRHCREVPSDPIQYYRTRVGFVGLDHIENNISLACNEIIGGDAEEEDKDSLIRYILEHAVNTYGYDIVKANLNLYSEYLDSPTPEPPKKLEEINPPQAAISIPYEFPVSITPHESASGKGSIFIADSTDGLHHAAISEALKIVIPNVETYYNQSKKGWYALPFAHKLLNSYLYELTGAPRLYISTPTKNGVQENLIKGDLRDPMFRKEIESALKFTSLTYKERLSAFKVEDTNALPFIKHAIKHYLQSDSTNVIFIANDEAKDVFNKQESEDIDAIKKLLELNTSDVIITKNKLAFLPGNGLSDNNLLFSGIYAHTQKGCLSGPDSERHEKILIESAKAALMIVKRSDILNFFTTEQVDRLEKTASIIEASFIINGDGRLVAKSLHSDAEIRAITDTAEHFGLPSEMVTNLLKESLSDLRTKGINLTDDTNRLLADNNILPLNSVAVDSSSAEPNVYYLKELNASDLVVAGSSSNNEERAIDSDYVQLLRNGATPHYLTVFQNADGLDVSVNISRTMAVLQSKNVVIAWYSQFDPVARQPLKYSNLCDYFQNSLISFQRQSLANFSETITLLPSEFPRFTEPTAAANDNSVEEHSALVSFEPSEDTPVVVGIPIPPTGDEAISVVPNVFQSKRRTLDFTDSNQGSVSRTKRINALLDTCARLAEKRITEEEFYDCYLTTKASPYFNFGNSRFDLMLFNKDLHYLRTASGNKRFSHVVTASDLYLIYQKAFRERNIDALIDHIRAYNAIHGATTMKTFLHYFKDADRLADGLPNPYVLDGELLEDFVKEDLEYSENYRYFYEIFNDIQAERSISTHESEGKKTVEESQPFSPKPNLPDGERNIEILNEQYIRNGYYALYQAVFNKQSIFIVYGQRELENGSFDVTTRYTINKIAANKLLNSMKDSADDEFKNIGTINLLGAVIPVEMNSTDFVEINLSLSELDLGSTEAYLVAQSRQFSQQSESTICGIWSKYESALIQYKNISERLAEHSAVEKKSTEEIPSDIKDIRHVELEKPKSPQHNGLVELLVGYAKDALPTNDLITILKSNHNVQLDEETSSKVKSMYAALIERYHPSVAPKVVESKFNLLREFILDVIQKEKLHYGVFLDEAFNDNGRYFERNPYYNEQKNGIDKKRAFEDTKASGFQDISALYEHCFKLVHGQSSNDNLRDRIGGFIPGELAATDNLASQFANVAKMLTSVNTTSALKASSIPDFATWLARDESQIPIHSIFGENLLHVAAEDIARRYPIEPILLLADVYGVDINNSTNPKSVAECVIKQLKIHQTAAGLVVDEMKEIDKETIRDLANVLGVTFSDSRQANIAAITARLNELNRLSRLRLAEYSFIAMALASEASGEILENRTQIDIAQLIKAEKELLPKVETDIEKATHLNLTKQVLQGERIIKQIGSVTRSELIKDSSLIDIVIYKDPKKAVARRSLFNQEGFTRKQLFGEGANYQYASPVQLEMAAWGLPKDFDAIDTYRLDGKNTFSTKLAINNNDLEKYRLVPLSESAIESALEPHRSWLLKYGFAIYHDDAAARILILTEEKKKLKVNIFSNGLLVEASNIDNIADVYTLLMSDSGGFIERDTVHDEYMHVISKDADLFKSLNELGSFADGDLENGRLKTLIDQASSIKSLNLELIRNAGLEERALFLRLTAVAINDIKQAALNSVLVGDDNQLLLPEITAVKSWAQAVAELVASSTVLAKPALEIEPGMELPSLWKIDLKQIINEFHKFHKDESLPPYVALFTEAEKQYYSHLTDSQKRSVASNIANGWYDSLAHYYHEQAVFAAIRSGESEALEIAKHYYSDELESFNESQTRSLPTIETSVKADIDIAQIPVFMANVSNLKHLTFLARKSESVQEKELALASIKSMNTDLAALEQLLDDIPEGINIALVVQHGDITWFVQDQSGGNLIHTAADTPAQSWKMSRLPARPRLTPSSTVKPLELIVDNTVFQKGQHVFWLDVVSNKILRQGEVGQTLSQTDLEKQQYKVTLIYEGDDTHHYAEEMQVDRIVTESTSVINAHFQQRIQCFQGPINLLRQQLEAERDGFLAESDWLSAVETSYFIDLADQKLMELTGLQSKMPEGFQIELYGNQYALVSSGSNENMLGFGERKFNNPIEALNDALAVNETIAQGKTREDSEYGTSNRISNTAQYIRSDGRSPYGEIFTDGDRETQKNTSMDASIAAISRTDGGDDGNDDDRPDGPGRGPKRGKFSTSARASSSGADEERGTNRKSHSASPGGLKFTFDSHIEALVSGSTAQREAKNVEAVKLRRELIDSQREATQEEKKVLALYSGWGGITAVFDSQRFPNNDTRTALQKYLLYGEYKAVMKSMLTAYYTPPSLVRGVYGALQHLGFNGGKILDPCTGPGIFLGLAPEDIRNSSTFAAREIDPLTADIARLLYGSDVVLHEGFEKAKLPKNFFDLVISNVPFGNYRVFDPDYKKNKFLIHDYFFEKSLDKTRPGGLIAFITSTGTLDKKNSDARQWISDRADLVGAIRLPMNTFLDSGGTSTDADIVFLKKREPNTAPLDDTWVQTVDIEVPSWDWRDEDWYDVTVNRYFHDHPEMILGNLRARRTEYGPKLYAVSNSNEALEKRILECAKLLPTNIYSPNTAALVTAIESRQVGSEAKLKLKPGNFVLSVDSQSIEIIKPIFITDTTQYELRAVPVTLKNDAVARVKGMIALRDQVRSVINIQVGEYTEEMLRRAQNRLSELYDAFVFQFGPLNHVDNRKPFSGDPDAPLLLALEIYDKESNSAKKTDIFDKATISVNRVPVKADTAQEALIICMGVKGCIDTAYMEQLTGYAWEQNRQALKGQVFKDPKSNQWQISQQYLSGNIKEKLDYAIPAALLDKDFKPNIQALRDIMPIPLLAHEIKARLGVVWIPEKTIEEFVASIVTSDGKHQPNPNDYSVSLHGASWVVRVDSSELSRNSGNVTREWGTSRLDAVEIIEYLLNNKKIEIIDKIGKDLIVNTDATAEANLKADAIAKTFKSWLWEDTERSAYLAEIYNKRYNVFVEPKYTGELIRFDGLASHLKGIPFDPHLIQKRAVERYLIEGRALLAHCVGAGKTFDLVAAAMEGKRIGIHKKALLVVPNSVLPNFSRLALSLYPCAKFLSIDPAKINKDGRMELTAQIATGDWDMVVIAQSSFKKIATKPEHQKNIIEEQKSELEEAMMLQSENGNASSRITLKSIQRDLIVLEKKIETLYDEKEKDNFLFLEELGVDALFVDESDNYLNLANITKMGRISGVNTSASKQAMSMYMAVRCIQELRGDCKGVIFATGTDIRNSMSDMYVNLRFLAPDMLESAGVNTFDKFMSTFGEIVKAIEVNPEGTGYREHERLSKFINVPEMVVLYRMVADIVTDDQLNIPKPKMEPVYCAARPSNWLNLYMRKLSERAIACREGGVDPKKDNILKISTEGRLASLDMRFINKNIPDDPNSKVNMCVKNTFDKWKEGMDSRHAQLIFIDKGTPNTKGFNLYEDIKAKLIKLGIPENQIVFAQDFKTDAEKIDLDAGLNSGRYRVAIGSTETLGVGRNVQERLIAIHNLDPAWRPRDFEQRIGRIDRQGNTVDRGYIFSYVTEDSFDLYIYETVKRKAKYIAQTKIDPRTAAREFEEDICPDWSEIIAITSRNPQIREKLEVDAVVERLLAAERSHYRTTNADKQRIVFLSKLICDGEKYISDVRNDLESLKRIRGFSINLDGKTHCDIKTASKALEEMTKEFNDETSVVRNNRSSLILGEYAGFKLSIEKEMYSFRWNLNVRGMCHWELPLYKNAKRTLEGIASLPDACDEKVELTRRSIERMKKEIQEIQDSFTPFKGVKELETLQVKQISLNSALASAANDAIAHQYSDKDFDEELKKLVKPAASLQMK